MRKPTDELEQSILILRQNDHFCRVMDYIAGEREHQISELGTYKGVSDLRKAAAEVTSLTKLLDIFGVPTGTVLTPTEEILNAT